MHEQRDLEWCSLVRCVVKPSARMSSDFFFDFLSYFKVRTLGLDSDLEGRKDDLDRSHELWKSA